MNKYSIFPFFFFSRTKTKDVSNGSLLISPVIDKETPKSEPVVPQPSSNQFKEAEDNILLDLGISSSKSIPSATNTTKPKNDDLFGGLMTDNDASKPKNDMFGDLLGKPSVPQPGTTKDDLLFGGGGGLGLTSNGNGYNQTSAAGSTKNDLFGDFTNFPSNNVAASSTSNINTLLDFNSTASSAAPTKDANLMAHPSAMMSKMKTSSSAEAFNNNTDPFDFLGTPSGAGTNVTLQPQQPKTSVPSSSMPKPATTADDLVSQMLNNLDMGHSKPASTSSSSMSSSAMNSSRPNYNVSFTKTANTAPGMSSSHQSNNQPSKKVSSNTFDDLLGGFNPKSSDDKNKTIGEMKNAETMKTMTPEEAKVFAWKDGKSRNLRALLCSLHTVIWENSRWKQCGMHELVSKNDVAKTYKKACLAAHPDRQMGTPNEELSKLIFIELNDAWAEFNKDS